MPTLINMRRILFGILSAYFLICHAAAQDPPPRKVSSHLEVLDISTGERTVVYSAPELFEAPNWSRDGKYFIFNQGGKLYTIPVTGGLPAQLNTGFAANCNNDHGISPDGTQLVISHQDTSSGQSLIYLLPINGGTPELITDKGPSYWHGWSPDGNTIAYCAMRNGAYDIYIKPLAGGSEIQLTHSPGLDDGPDYAADGRHIYFNSERTGTMKIWRMKPDGSREEQITFDKYNDWFPHPSPDGKWLIFLSYQPEVDASQHPRNKNVLLRIMPAEGGKPKIIARLLGGQGTINVPSWSPDSRKVAFVSYVQ